MKAGNTFSLGQQSASGSHLRVRSPPTCKVTINGSSPTTTILFTCQLFFFIIFFFLGFCFFPHFSLTFTFPYQFFQPPLVSVSEKVSWCSEISMIRCSESWSPSSSSIDLGLATHFVRWKLLGFRFCCEAVDLSTASYSHVVVILNLSVSRLGYNF